MYDVIVAGAGNGGLIAALTAVRKGLKTLLIEQHNLPGGFASSFVRGRFEFEPSLHEPCDVGPADSPGGLGELFARNELDIEWARVPEAYRLITTDDPKGNIDVVMPFGVDAFVEAIEAKVPGSADSLNKFFALSREILAGLGYLADSKGHADRKLLVREYPNFLKSAPYGVDAVEKALGIPEDARRILNAYWCYLGIPSSRMNFTVFAAMALKYLNKGVFLPKARSHEISSAIMSKFQEQGGEVMYNTRVESVRVEGGRVRGVRTDKGSFDARAVISNIPRHVLFSAMIEPKSAVPEAELRAAHVRRPGAQGFVLYLGLDKSAEELGFKEYSYFIYPSMDTEALYRSTGSLEDNRIQATICLNKAVPDCSPPGTSIVSFTTLFTGAAWDGVNQRDYFKTKETIARRMIGDFERATGIRLSDSIEEISTAAPPTFARYANAYNGSVYGYEAESWDSLLPRMMMMDEDDSVPGLRFCGGHAFRLHGYSSAYLSGETAALLTLRDMKERS